MKGFILVIDDNPIDLRIVREVIDQENYLCAAFTSYYLAKEWLKEETPKAIILDLVMPDYDGFKLIKTFRNDARLKKTPIMILSGKKDFVDVKTAISLGADDYIVKPIDIMVFQQKLNLMLSHIEKEAAETPLRSELESAAVVQWAVEIQSVSEFGLTLKTPMALKQEQIISLNEFNEDIFGQGQLQLKVYSIQEIGGGAHLVQCTFVGLSASRRQFIRSAARRLWVAKREIKSAA